MAEYTKLDELAWKDRASSESDDDDKALLEGGSSSGHSRRSWFHLHRWAILMHAAFLCANACLLIAFSSGWLSLRHFPDPHYRTPFKNVISYEEREFEIRAIYLNNGTLNPLKTNAFSGPPREELESQWGHLMKHENVRVYKSELGQFKGDDSIVELGDGSGFYSTVAVFHGLHCVQRLHHYLYRDHYYSGLSEKELFLLKRHTEHCLDWLRQYVQCNADTTLIPIHWSADSPGPVADDSGKHQCVVWDGIYNWMSERSFNPFDSGLLIHPIFGNPYAKHNSTSHGKNLGLTPLGNGGLLHGHHG